MFQNVLSRILATGLVLSSASALAYSEDLCVKTDPMGRPYLADCLSSVSCAPGSSTTAACRANVVLDAGAATSAGTGRSMIHMDSTYLIAQAVGFRWDIAYWIAAYDEVTDLGEYSPFDQCGTVLSNPTLQAAKINGFQRTDASHGGFGYHFVTAFSATGSGSDLGGVTGLHPNLSDNLHEGMLTQLRRWAQDSAGQPMCTNGFTSRAPLSGAPYNNLSCYDPLPGSGSKLIVGEVPLFTPGGARLLFSAYNGDQYLMSTSSGDAYASALPAILASSSGRLQTGPDAGQTVPAVLAKLGFYLHILQDRISHHRCGDVSYVRWENPAYRFVYEPTSSPTECTQDQHAFGHYEELARNAPLPDRTYAGLNYTYAELKAFADALHASKPEWFTPLYAAPISRDTLIGSTGMPGSLAKVLMVSGGPTRIVAETRMVSDNGLVQLPGHSSATTCH